MSLKSWCEEYYPVPADDPSVQANDVTRLEHSLKKWEGLRKENLERHGGRKCIIDDVIHVVEFDNGDFSVGGGTCSLCVGHRHCNGCPIVNAGIRCCLSSPYGLWIRSGNPEPMITVLREALERERK